LTFKAINFTCKSCGAPLRFSPINNSLHCEFCATKESIKRSVETIQEYDLKTALQSLDSSTAHEVKKEVTCNKCSATFTMTPYSFSSNCPYCDTPSIIDFVQEITPKSLLPFQISKEEAKRDFQKWISSLWFAPSQLKKIANSDKELTGYYLPHWTYDASTTTHYQGQRGDIYYVTVEKNVIIDGREVRRRVQEARIRWTPVSGYVNDEFDDITIGASKTISRTILENLTPWHTEKLIPYNDKYLAGFESEEYTIGLDNGFELAKVKMDSYIRNHIHHDIGGDQQQISKMQTTYKESSYKNVLFPIWTAQFKWNNKLYNYAINAQTGKIVGERPYSWLKIALLVGGISSGVGGAIYIDKHSNALKSSYIQLKNTFTFH